jgi:hypothetical protein
MHSLNHADLGKALTDDRVRSAARVVPAAPRRPRVRPGRLGLPLSFEVRLPTLRGRGAGL